MEDRASVARKLRERLPAPEEIREDWSEFLMDAVLPDGVWGRPGLSQRDRSLITIASLTALYRPNELRMHVERGLENGVSRAEICEIIMHMAIYGGFPVAVEGMRIARETFDDLDGSGSG